MARSSEERSVEAANELVSMPQFDKVWRALFHSDGSPTSELMMMITNGFNREELWENPPRNGL